MRHVVAVATTAAVAAGAATAVGQGTSGPPTGALSFEMRDTAQRNRGGINPAVPRDKKRPKVADMFAGNSDLLVDGKRVGRAHYAGTITFEGAKKYKGGAVLLESNALDFGGGNLLFTSCVGVDTPRPSDNRCAVTGGTGRYAGARGSALFQYTKGKEDKRRRTFTFPVTVTFVD